MHRLLIENYVKQINKKDIYNFALQNNIILTDEDIDILYHYLQNYWQEVLFGDKEKIFIQLEKEVGKEKFLKIKSLFDFYFEKYQNLL